MKLSLGDLVRVVRSGEHKRERKMSASAKKNAVARAEAAAAAQTGDGIGGVKHHRLVGYASVLNQETTDEPRG